MCAKNTYSITVIGDWPKPVYLEVPDSYRAARKGRLYIPAEFNSFLQKLKQQSKGIKYSVYMYSLETDMAPLCSFV